MQHRTFLLGFVALAFLGLGQRSQAAYTLTNTTPVPPSPVFGGTSFTFASSSPGTGGVQTGSTISNFNIADVGVTSSTAPPAFDTGMATITETFTLTGTPGTEAFTLTGTLMLLSGNSGGVASTFTNAMVTVNSGSGYTVSFAGYAPPTPGSGGIGGTTGNLSILVNPNVIPEPASIAMLGLGLVGLGGYTLRRRMAN